MHFFIIFLSLWFYPSLTRSLSGFCRRSGSVRPLKRGSHVTLQAHGMLAFLASICALSVFWFVSLSISLTFWLLQCHRTFHYYWSQLVSVMWDSPYFCVSILTARCSVYFTPPNVCLFVASCFVIIFCCCFFCWCLLVPKLLWFERCQHNQTNKHDIDDLC